MGNNGVGLGKIGEIFRPQVTELIDLMNKPAAEDTSGSTFGDEIIDNKDMGTTVEHNPNEAPEEEPEIEVSKEKDGEFYKSKGKADEYFKANEEAIRKAIAEKGEFKLVDKELGVELVYTIKDEVVHVQAIIQDNNSGSTKAKKQLLSDPLIQETQSKTKKNGKVITRSHIIRVDGDSYIEGTNVKRKTVEDFGFASEERRKEYQQKIDEIALANNEIMASNRYIGSANGRKNKAEMRRRAKEAKEALKEMVKQDLGITNKRELEYIIKDQVAHARAKYTTAYVDRKEFAEAEKALRKQQTEILKKNKEDITDADLEVLRKRVTLVDEVGLISGAITRHQLRKKGIDSPDEVAKQADRVVGEDNTLTYEEAAKERSRFGGLTKKQSKELAYAQGYNYAPNTEKQIKTAMTIASAISVAAKVANAAINDVDPKMGEKILNIVDDANSASESFSIADASATGQIEFVPTDDGNWILKIIKTIVTSENGVETGNTTEVQEIPISSADFAGFVVEWMTNAHADASATANADAAASITGKIQGLLEDLGYNGKKEIVDAVTGYMLGLVPQLADFISFEGARNTRTFVGTAAERYYNGNEEDGEMAEAKKYAFDLDLCPPENTSDGVDNNGKVDPPGNNNNGDCGDKEPCDCDETIKINIAKSYTLGETAENSKGETVAVYYGLLDKDILKCFKVAEGQEVAEGSPIPSKQFKAFIEKYREEKLGSKRAYIGKGEQEICTEFTFNGVEYKFDIQAFEKLLNDFEVNPGKFKYLGGGKNIKAVKINEKPCK